MQNNLTVQDSDLTNYLSSLRGATDYSVPSNLIFAAPAAWILWTLYFLEFLLRPLTRLTGMPESIALGVLGFPALITTIPVAYLVYLILNRRNVHFRRSELMMQAFIRRIKAGIPQSDMGRLFATNTVERDLWQIGLEEKESSAYLWSLLTLVPYVGGFFLAFSLFKVGRDFQSHERREFTTLGDIQRTLGPANVSPPPSTGMGYFNSSYPRRNLGLYFLASVVTAGLFSIYWLHNSIYDVLPHFEAQHRLEDNVKNAVPKEPTGSAHPPLESLGGEKSE